LRLSPPKAKDGRVYRAVKNRGSIFSGPWTERAHTMAPVTTEEEHFGK